MVSPVLVVAMALELGGGRRLLCCPQPALIGRDSYQGDATPALYETVAGAAADSNTPVLLWLPGAGQLPENELLRRLTNALHGVGARMVITSAAYDDRHTENGDHHAILAQLFVAGVRRIYVGGHSRGGAEALEMSAALPQGCELAGVCTINPYPRTAAAPGTRSLTIVGEPNPSPDPNPNPGTRSLTIVGEQDGGLTLTLTLTIVGEWPFP